MKISFQERLKLLEESYFELITLKNKKKDIGNGIFDRYVHPVLTARHTPIFWRYDLNPETNPYLMERFGINAAFNAGAIKLNGKYMLVVRVEGVDRKSFFAVAESPNGIDNFIFWERPVTLQKAGEHDTNVYDMRLTQHEDGWIYGLFCTERKDPDAKIGDEAAAIAQCGIVRTHDLKTWERLPNLKTPSRQQRNVVLHPEFVSGKYAFYTRPQDSFIEAGTGGGIGFGLVDDITNAVIDKEWLVHGKQYHTVYEMKNGQGPAPLKSEKGWLHLAHGVRNTAAGLRYVLYMFMTSLEEPSKIIYNPAGYIIAPTDDERIGDVSNVIFGNGWIMDDDGTVFIYYGSSDTRMHVATTTLERLLDYVVNTPADAFYSAASVQRLNTLIDKNLVYLKDQEKKKAIINNGLDR